MGKRSPKTKGMLPDLEETDARRWVPEPDEPHVRWLGRRWFPAGWLERVFWGALALGCAVVLGVALSLEPDPRGLGTHEQLGLPPCGFAELFDGAPCPSCGFTTTFVLAAHGRVGEAVGNQPFGFVLFVAAALLVPVGAAAAWTGASLAIATEGWPWGGLTFVVVVSWGVAWGYKWQQTLG